ncbi:Piso0_001685 [Millerozyma farinosa CBS 7064]|uniref:Protein kinase C-like 1 n=1 Tax=Pichia sorbitophila (strain ATCC MYA-4447 / BCRC 22081 / CBS 7064 / NBRC 10061 / NRRL Y-12695) TaxID=559304 RepID=G8YNU0_PICSO|nr:Piso0_001685 [Millerozyma farinosa CBS 7064]
MSDSRSELLDDIRGKIERERRLIQGFHSLKRNTDNAEVIQRCNNQIRETQSNIDYLESTLAKVSIQQQTGSAPGSPDKASPAESESKPVYSRLDLIKYDCPSLGHRIQYMLQQLQFKLQVENQYREANQKISQLYKLDGDKSSSDAADSGRLESDQRIHLLNKSLKRYQDIHISMEDVTRDMEIMNTPKYARKPLTGKLGVSVTCVRDIDHIVSPMFSKRPESVVAIKVDDVEKARTRGSRSGKWNEEFSIDIDKGNEVEFAVYDKSGNNYTLVALTWALLSDITEEIRKRKVAHELGNGGWVSASNLAGAGGNKQSYNSYYPNQNSTMGSSTMGSAPFSGNLSGSAGSNAGSEMNSSTSTANAKPVQINTWLNLEPVGQILISLTFEKSNRKGRQFMGALGRHGAIRQKKEEVFKQHGHQFVQKQFYNIMCCAFCGEFLRYTGYQCQDCKFLCHKKCFPKVVTKCISKSATDIDPDEAKLNHSIPHRFEPVANHGTKWCCHCGYILPWGRKNVRKCTECGVMCHAYCTHLVPDFCGMSMEMANKILTTIKSTKTPTVTAGTSKQHATRQNAVSTEKNSSELDYKAEVLHISDDDNDKLYDQKLPTTTTHEIQKPIDLPLKQVGRRPPPADFNGHVEQAREEIAEYVKRSQNDVPVVNEDNFRNDRLVSHTVEHVPAVADRSSDELGNEDVSRMQVDSVPYPERSSQVLQGFNATQPQDYSRNDQYNSSYENMPSQQMDHGMGKPSPSHAVSQAKQQSPHRHKRKRRKVGLDDFQFLAVLGKGNFGKVMLAKSRHTEKLCAIKVLKKDIIVESDESESVRSEKRVFLAANKGMHPFLLNLPCCFQTENRIYFVMEYIPGGDLMWHIQKSRFSARRAKFYACEVLLALKYFHEKGVVYRDLKLDNILLTTKGHIKIADYGLCKENMWYKNTTGTFCGTPEFMAPEIVTGKQYDRSVDWWAFGVLLFQMLLCQSPFKGDDEEEIFNAIENDEVRYPISMPRQTVLVLQALLTKDPSRRLGSSERDALEIMEHPYFQDVNFDDVLQCNTQVPYLPEISSEHDYSNFDQEFTSETPRLTPVETVLTAEMQEQFRGFSYLSEEAGI